jgi:hypothetical protein
MPGGKNYLSSCVPLIFKYTILYIIHQLLYNHVKTSINILSSQGTHFHVKYTIIENLNLKYTFIKSKILKRLLLL